MLISLTLPPHQDNNNYDHADMVLDETIECLWRSILMKTKAVHLCKIIIWTTKAE